MPKEEDELTDELEVEIDDAEETGDDDSPEEEESDEPEKDGDGKDKADEGKEKPEEKPKKDPELGALKRQMKNLQKQNRALQRGMREWYERATRTEKKDEPEEDIDLIDALTNGDKAKIAKGVGKLGFVHKSEVDAAVANLRRELYEKDLRGKYPFLADEDSPLFDRTAAIYNELKSRDPQLAKSPALIEIAAERAQLERKGRRRDDEDEEEEPRRPKAKRGSRREDDEEDIDVDNDTEVERRLRVSAQQGTRGRRNTRDTEDPESEELSALQRSIVAKFRQHDDDITEEGYKKRARGITLHGLPPARGIPGVRRAR